MLLVATLLLTSVPGGAAEAAAARTCRGETATITGSGELTGTQGRDVIVATEGDTKVRARGGDDLVCGSFRVDGGRGDDAIHYGGRITFRDDIWIRGGAGADLIQFHGDQDSPSAGTRLGIYGDGGDDTIIGSDGILWFFGGAGDDRLVANGGGDLMDGGPGDDLMLGGPGQEIMYGGGGDDLMYGRGHQDELQGGPGHDEAWGGPDTDICPPGNEVERECERDSWV